MPSPAGEGGRRPDEGRLYGRILFPVVRRGAPMCAPVDIAAAANTHGGVGAPRPTYNGNDRRRAACPHAAVQRAHCRHIPRVVGDADPCHSVGADSISACAASPQPATSPSKTKHHPLNRLHYPAALLHRNGAVFRFAQNTPAFSGTRESLHEIFTSGQNCVDRTTGEGVK